MADDPQQRGVLDVRTKAIQHIVERVVTLTPGTVATRTAMGSLRGSNLPRASVSMQGGSARISVDVACAWPCRLSEIVAQVRDSVRTETARMAGSHVRSVDVKIHAVGAEDLAPSERRRVE